MNNIARLVLAIIGVAAIAWVVAVFPVFWSEKVIIDVAGEIIVGNVFKPEVLAAVEAQTETNSGPMRRSSVLGKAAVIRLRQAEDAIRAANLELQDKKLESLSWIVDKTLLNAPSDSFLWLVRFWLDSRRNGLRPDNLRFLRMSYDLGPFEGWLAVKRNPIALAAYPVLPSDLTEQAISEFVGLVRWGFVHDAGTIAGGLGRPLREVLFARLKDLDNNQRRVFANNIYARELDDVPVPGFPPPTRQIPMPVLPPGF